MHIVGLFQATVLLPVYTNRASFGNYFMFCFHLASKSSSKASGLAAYVLSPACWDKRWPDSPDKLDVKTAPRLPLLMRMRETAKQTPFSVIEEPEFLPIPWSSLANSTRIRGGMCTHLHILHHTALHCLQRLISSEITPMHLTILPITQMELLVLKRRRYTWWQIIVCTIVATIWPLMTYISRPTAFVTSPVFAITSTCTLSSFTTPPSTLAITIMSTYATTSALHCHIWSYPPLLPPLALHRRVLSHSHSEPVPQTPLQPPPSGP